LPEAPDAPCPSCALKLSSHIRREQRPDVDQIAEGIERLVRPPMRGYEQRVLHPIWSVDSVDAEKRRAG
jgi:hypothetical protein